MKHTFLIITLFCLLQFVQPTTAAPLAGEAIPVWCFSQLGTNTSLIGNCRRVDTDASFTTVPATYYFVVTDVLISPLDLNSDIFQVLIGRDLGTPSPTAPRIRLSGSGLNDRFVSFKAPNIILSAGQGLRITSLSQSTTVIEAQISGYLVTDLNDIPTAIGGLQSSAESRPAVMQTGGLLLLVVLTVSTLLRPSRKETAR